MEATQSVRRGLPARARIGDRAPDAEVDTNSWFVRLAVFVVILVILDRFFAWNISIIGSLVVTGLVYLVLQALERWRSS